MAISTGSALASGHCPGRGASPDRIARVAVLEICGPIWKSFAYSHGGVAATAELHNTAYFRVQLKNKSGELLKTIRLGLHHKGIAHLRFRLGTLAAGTYTVSLDALPTGKKLVLGLNPVTLKVTANGRSTAHFVNLR